MRVPERTVVAGNSEDGSFSRPVPFKPLLKTSPHVLTLSQRPLDFLDSERPPFTCQKEEIRAAGRLQRECSMSENAVCQNGQLVRSDSIRVLCTGSAAAASNSRRDNVRCGIPTADTATEGASEDITVGDVASLTPQILTLKKRLQFLEEENKEKEKWPCIQFL
ncbi:mitochondrial fission factor-like [Lepus europaeus]|uniref:mitochondrial fission factor-like n=1 Tax=Lepus europaeus TaxID=9983 RepID=UPI002B490F6A|nr:mitochondrial fission factor-like [Lepus europaeus]